MCNDSFRQQPSSLTSRADLTHQKLHEALGAALPLGTLRWQAGDEGTALPMLRPWELKYNASKRVTTQLCTGVLPSARV